MTRHRILFVDDDPQMQELYQMLGAYLGEDYDAYVAPGGAHALKLLEEMPMDIIVSDLAMPEMSGREFLTRVVAKFPESIRIVISGHADQLTVAQCLMFGHRYFQKPFLLENFTATLKRICRLKYLVGSDKIKRVVCGLGALPTPPDTYLRLSETLNSPDSSIDDITRIVLEDPGLTVKVLQIVNSAEFGIARRINTPSEAVQIIGYEILRALMLSVQAFKFYDNKPPKSLSVTQLWNHSLRTAVAAKRLARFEKLSPDDSEAAFVSGLLHDIGKLVLAVNADSEYEILIKRSHTESLPIEVLEQMVFGASHAHIGAYLLGLWGLPDLVVDTVEAHHSLGMQKSKGFSVATAVHLAQCLEPAGKRITNVDHQYLEQIGVPENIGVWQQVLDS
ncbi:MAG: hypothetical protein JWM99_1063 [Verrucomicrobiales bacterium]|nr:hypothetical protein [Verrucomicrobiales bacterium]